ncbi:hypothetical protein VB711_14215 [Cronbergia sp. UHCC 0137]|uniref:hypothetical protein n=1 Tax=Cronbergia sp. UHCC 0137 TaxID=3110239 RepID=UPI002B20AC00|nr:hypothetical protein [Cronbergia sp. UHCC 0137]MEA5618987.1 hypothetical protein [Cronbergia sp. UHCC 0137]
MLEFISLFIHAIQPFLAPICFIGAWYVIILVLWTLWTTARNSISTAKQMHQIPCHNCQFFTNNYRLKCTVHPSRASTEAAVDCCDYQPKTNPYLY